VDVAILPAPGKDLSLAEELRIVHALSLATRCEVDVVRLDSANPLVRREVARQGRLIIERSGGAWARFAPSALLE
jgi:Polymerase beta, Nucleotidyltransferase